MITQEVSHLNPQEEGEEVSQENKVQHSWTLSLYSVFCPEETITTTNLVDDFLLPVERMADKDGDGKSKREEVAETVAEEGAVWAKLFLRMASGTADPLLTSR